VGLGIVGGLVCVGLALVAVRRCDAEATKGDVARSHDGATTAVSGDATVPRDPLLADAWSRIEGGQIPEDIVSALLASDAPAHQRARRLLEAMHAQAEPREEEEPPADEGVPLVPPKIASETTAAEPASVPAPTPAPRAAHSSTNVPKSRPSRGGRASLSGISLREHARGATLTLHASGGVVAGVANQPRSGIVRLVVQSRGAAAKALAARPRVAGARVTEVRSGSDTVIVTLELDPGWSLGTIERTSSGARIHLSRPR
jgi:hypothetical protein